MLIWKKNQNDIKMRIVKYSELGNFLNALQQLFKFWVVKANAILGPKNGSYDFVVPLQHWFLVVALVILLKTPTDTLLFFSVEECPLYPTFPLRT